MKIEFILKKLLADKIFKKYIDINFLQFKIIFLLEFKIKASKNIKIIIGYLILNYANKKLENIN